MLRSKAGLPCWYPKPCKPIGERGVVPGDVGTFDLTDGFRRIFNLWEDELFASYRLPCQDVIVHSEHFAEGHTIVSGTSANVRRTIDGKYGVNSS
jgi:hypothetical protein